MSLKAVSKVSARNRVYLPREIAELLGLAEGDYLVFREIGGRVVVEKLK